MSIKEKLINGKYVIGTWCILPSPAVVNVLAKAGLDFIIVDLEHGPIDPNTAAQMVMTAEAEGCDAIIRVSSNNESHILSALDTGACGVIVPHIETTEDRKQAISNIKYPPVGKRGFSPYTRAGGYTFKQGFTKLENDRILSGIIIESAESVKNIDEIIDDTELDLVYIGAYDISVSLGIPGQVQDPRITSILADLAKKIKKAGKAAGAIFHDIKEAEKLKSFGIQLLCFKVDSNILFENINSTINQLNR